jgi:hypothetical protein
VEFQGVQGSVGVKRKVAQGGEAETALPLLNVNAGTSARGERHAAKGF